MTLTYFMARSNLDLWMGTTEKVYFLVAIVLSEAEMH